MDSLTPEAAQSLCREFNKLYPVGSTVVLIKDMGEVVSTRIKWPAEVTLNGPMVGLECSPGKWLLSRVIPQC